MNSLFQDVRYGLRMMLRTPGVTLIALLALTLGIGANSAIFSVVNSVLLRPLPYPDAERLVFLNERSPQMEGMSISYPNFTDWRARNQVFEQLGVYRRDSYNLTGSGEPERLLAGQMSADLFAALQVAPALGRVYTNEDDKPGGAAVVVLSYGLWQRRFGGDPKIVGQTIQLNNKAWTVIGVMPQSFQFPTRVEMWTPVGQRSSEFGWQQRGNHPGLQGVARLKPGVTFEQAKTDLDAIAVALEKEFPRTNTSNRVRMRTLMEVVTGDVRTSLWILLGAVGFVLLIACANVANLLLARAASRQRELAIRTAMGAGRWRIIRQLLTESVMLSVTGGVLGLMLSQWGVDLLIKLGAGSLPRTSEIQLDNRVVVFTFALSVLTGILFGLVPALQSSKQNLHETLKDAARGSTGSRHLVRSGLVVAEVALTLVLLTGAGLLLRSFYNLQQVNPGFGYDNVLAFSVALPRQKYETPEQQSSFYQQLTQKLRALPGVKETAYSSGLPLGYNGSQTSFTIDGRPLPPLNEMPLMEMSQVSPDYFRAMNIPLKAGRVFTEQDNLQHLVGRDLSKFDEEQKLIAGLNVIVIDEEFARRHWPGEDAVGKRLRVGRDLSVPTMTVVGVVGRVKMDGLNAETNYVQGYFSTLQIPSGSMTAIIKTAMEPEQITQAARQAVLALDPNQPIYDITTLADIRAESLAPDRINLVLLGLFAALAIILAVVGIYGVMSYAVTQRTHEIGIRMALGAQKRDVLRLVVGHGMKLALIGTGLGLGAALILTRWMASLLFGVSATDPLTFLSIALLLTMVAFVACWLPARRATRVDPMIALRYE